MNRIRLVGYAFRTPFLLLGACLLLTRESLIPNLILLLSHTSPERTIWGTFSLRLDYWLYLPNVVVGIGSFLAAFLVLEIKHALLPRNPRYRWDLWVALAALALAIIPPFLMANQMPGFLQWLTRGVQVMFLWLFLTSNAGLLFAENHCSGKRWLTDLSHWTFPVADLFFYSFHRDRIRRNGGGGLRWIPPLSVLALLAGLLWAQGRILWDAIPAQRLDIPVRDPYWAEPVAGGFWFSNGDWWDPKSGIWYYDEKTGASFPHVRATDVRRFYVEDGSFYLHDRFDNHLLRIDMKTRQPLWRVPTQPAGTVELVTRNGLLFSVGEGGYIAVVDQEGTLLAERQFARAWAPQALRNGSVAFTMGDLRLFIWNSRLTTGEAIPLPLSPGILDLPYRQEEGRIDAITVWTDYDDRSDVVYVVALWGEIFRYRVAHRQWLTSFKTAPGLRSIAVDNQNGLLFAWNYLQGYLDVLELESGRLLGRILANPLGRYINLDPQRRRGILNTHGYGLYQFDYNRLALPRPIRKPEPARG